MNNPTALPIAPLSTLLLICTLALFALSGCGSPSGSSASDASSPEGASSESVPSAPSAGQGGISGESEPPSDAPASMSSSAAEGNPELAKTLKADLKPIVAKSGMDMGVCVIDPESNTHVSAGGKKRMVAASMIKLIVATSFLEFVDAGKFSLDDVYTIKESDIVGGSGSLGGRGAGAEVAYKEIFDKMLAESDNTAANILINTVGMNAVNKTAEKLDLTSTQLNRLMMDEEAIADGKENYTSANDLATVLELACKGDLISPKASKTLIAALERQADDTGILAGLPSGTKFAHKTGALANAQNDGGIVMAKTRKTDGDANDDSSSKHDFIVVVMTGGNGYSLDGALEAMSDIGRIAYRDIVG